MLKKTNDFKKRLILGLQEVNEDLVADFQQVQRARSADKALRAVQERVAQAPVVRPSHHVPEYASLKLRLNKEFPC